MQASNKLLAHSKRACQLMHTTGRRPAQSVRAMSAQAVQNKPVTIAVDGPAASGKGTLSRNLAKELRLAHLDTGALYRAVGYKTLQAGVPFDDEARIEQLAQSIEASDLASPELRSEATGAAASKVSTLMRVRAAVGEFPKQFAENPPPGSSGAVLDGRDVGTVLLPNATLKLFITASDEVRAQRRLDELKSRGGNLEGVTFEKVLQDMRERDRRDRERAAAPLKAADDAVIIDTSNMNEAQVMDASIAEVKRACPWLLEQSSVGSSS
ncbi:cytidylate kinase protein [Dunaliella salina]|uniref:(d)CMP kinase n=1 Tax=Dunaliella salina TaxID=3046 RepID=A0ABQ7GBQ0_DUNSA|nr:cytidylate kinase protein [Dunaliella salina]|eukprot:KAF5832037.1 cytidylate kinase protein [Dunaliella salina]